MKYPLLMGMLFPVVALAVAVPLSVLILPTPTVTGQTTAGQIAAPPSPASAATASPPSTSGLAPKFGQFRVETRLRSRVQHGTSWLTQGRG